MLLSTEQLLLQHFLSEPRLLEGPQVSVRAPRGSSHKKNVVFRGVIIKQSLLSDLPLHKVWR